MSILYFKNNIKGENLGGIWGKKKNMIKVYCKELSMCE